jgi:hypothetical protein
VSDAIQPFLEFLDAIEKANDPKRLVNSATVYAYNFIPITIGMLRELRKIHRELNNGEGDVLPTREESHK